MNSILAPWSGLEPAALALLIEAALKGSALLLVAAALTFVLRRRSAAVRHLVWGVALAALLALPALLTVMPSWRVAVPVANRESSWSATAAAPTANSQLVTPPAAKDADTPAEASPRVATGGLATSDEAAAPPSRPMRWTDALFAIWAVGAAGVLGLFALGHLVLRLTTRDARLLRDRDWQEQANEAAAHLGLDLPFALLQSPTAPVPVTFGLLRPRILLPASAEQWPADQRRAVLLHELAHVRRHDCLTQALAQICCALFWFHPAVWWAASRMRIERERACDDLVLAGGTRPSAYADHLLGVVRGLRGTRLAALGAVAFARPSQFEGRLLAVLDPQRDRRGVSRRLALPAAAFASLAMLPIAAIEFDGVPASHATTGRDFERWSRASSVVAAPETERLEQRLSWIETQASRSGGDYWIGWQLESGSDAEGDMLGDTGSLDLRTLDDESGAFSLEDVIAGRSSSTWPATRNEAHRPLAILFHAPQAGKPEFDRIRIQTMRLPAALGQKPLYWAGTVPDEQSLGVMRRMLSREQDPAVRREMVHAIASHQPTEIVVPFLEEVIGSDQPASMRAAAAEGLGRHRSHASLLRLTALAQGDRSSQVRRSAVEALGRFKTQEAMDVLLSLAADPGDATVRRQAFDQLGEKVAEGSKEEGITVGGSGAGDVHWKQTVKQGMKHEKTMAWSKETRKKEYDSDGDGMDPDPNPDPTYDPDPNPGAHDEPAADDTESEDDPVQRQAVESLGRFPEAQALPRLREIARTHHNSQVRAQAVESIARYGTPAALDAVRDIVWNNSSRDARVMAVEYMGRKFKSEDVPDRLMEVARKHPDADARRMAVETIGRMELPQVPTMLEQFVNGPFDTELQRQAVEMIGRRKDPGASKRLREIAMKHRDAEVQRQAVEMIGRRGEEDAVQALAEIARRHPDTDVQREAVERLGRIDSEDTIPLLGDIARTHPSSDVRRQAVETMSRRDPEKALPILEDIIRHKGSRSKS